MKDLDLESMKAKNTLQSIHRVINDIRTLHTGDSNRNSQQIVQLIERHLETPSQSSSKLDLKDLRPRQSSGIVSMAPPLVQRINAVSSDIMDLSAITRRTQSSPGRT